MAPHLSENVTLNGDGSRWRLTINKPTKVLAGILITVAGAFGGFQLRPYLDTADNATARTGTYAEAVNRDSQMVDLVSVLMSMNGTLAGMSERMTRIETNTLYLARDVERASRDAAENQKNIEALRLEIARLRERDVVLEK